MPYRPKDIPDGGPIPYGGAQPDWPYGPASSAIVFADDGGGCWGFFDPDWRDDDGTVRGQFRINVSSPTGHGGTGSDHQTRTWLAKADDWFEIVDRVQAAVRFARDEGAREAQADEGSINS